MVLNSIKLLLLKNSKYVRLKSPFLFVMKRGIKNCINLWTLGRCGNQHRFFVSKELTVYPYVQDLCSGLWIVSITAVLRWTFMMDTYFIPFYLLMPGPTKTFFSYEGPPLFLDRISNQEWNTKEIQPSAWEPRPWSKMNLGCNWDLSILLITLIKLIVCPLVSCSISLRICSKFMPKCEE